MLTPPTADAILRSFLLEVAMTIAREAQRMFSSSHSECKCCDRLERSITSMVSGLRCSVVALCGNVQAFPRFTSLTSPILAPSWAIWPPAWPAAPRYGDDSPRGWPMAPRPMPRIAAPSRRSHQCSSPPPANSQWPRFAVTIRRLLPEVPGYTPRHGGRSDLRRAGQALSRSLAGPAVGAVGRPATDRDPGAAAGHGQCRGGVGFRHRAEGE